MEKTKFVTGRRYLMYRNLSIVLNVIIVGVFYLIYNRIFIGQDAPPSIPLLVVFIGVAALASYITFRIYARLAKRYYKVEKDGLVYFNGKTTVKYHWSTFKTVRYETFKFSHLYPVRFITSKGEFYILQQIENVPELIRVIIENVEGSAEIDSEVYSRFNAKL